MSWFWPLTLSIAMAVMLYPVMNQYSQSFKFVDEAEHMVMAWLMGKGYRLYQNFPNNHQPLPYMASYLTQYLSQIDNVYMLIRRHRQVIFIWSAAWWVILIKRFGKKAAVPIFLFESLKYLLLGNQFLAESLVVYPLSYLSGSLLDLKEKAVSKWGELGIGILTGLIQFTLLPMAAALTLLTLFRYLKIKGKDFGWFILGIISVIIGVFIVVPPKDYLIEVINALRYSLPGLTPIKHWWEIWRLPGLPFLYLFHIKDILSQTVGLIMIFWLLALGRLIYLKQKTQALVVLGLLIIWLSTNTRVAEANVYYYRGFHLIPWLGIGLLVSFLAAWPTWMSLRQKWRLAVGLGIGVWMIVILTKPNLPLYTQINPETEHYIQFTPMVQAAEMIKRLKQPGDRLMVIPNEALIYYLADLEPAPTNMLTYYDWQVQVPKNRWLFFKTLNETPPTFIVYEDDGSSYSPMMNEYLKSKYLPIKPGSIVYLNRQELVRMTKEK